MKRSPQRTTYPSHPFSYKKLALRHHPMKHPSEMKIHLEKFHLLCEAYEILSNRICLHLLISYSEMEDCL